MLISDAEHNVSFREYLDGKIDKSSYTICNQEWIQFLQDHFEELRDTGSYVDLTEADMQRFKYRISDFLQSGCRMPAGLEQAFRVVNRLHNDLDFDLSIKYAIVPSLDTLSDLRHKFNTAKTMERMA